MDDMSLVYNINLCRICQIPEHSDLVKTDTISGNGDTYLDQMKYIFEDILWIEDKLISLACKTCLEKVTDIAEFKRLCLETNGRRGALTFDSIKVEFDEIKLEEDKAVTEQADDEPEVEASPQQRSKRKLSIFEQDQSKELKSLKIKQKTKRKKKIPISSKMKIKRKIKKRPKKHEESPRSDSEYEDNAGLDDIDENIENENVIDENIVTNSNNVELIQDGESKEVKKLSLYVPQYKPNENERTCRICKRKFRSLNKLKEHVASDHVKLRRYRCDICHEAFTGQDSLNRHMFKHNGSRNYICTVCGRKYITFGDLCHHKKRHVEEFKYVCDVCPDKKFKTYCSLRTHKLIVHTDPKDYKYLCTQCGSKFPSSGGLKVHMLRHSNIKNFPCHMCDKSFCTRAEMLRHTSTHSNMRPFKCDLCPAEYKHKQILLIHKTKRHGIGNYKYQIEKKFDCSFCDKKIASKDKLQRHLRTHTGVKPFKCRLCDQKFICKSYIKGHMRTKHDINVDAPDYKTSLYYDVCDEEVSRDDVTGDVKVEPTDGASNQDKG